MIADRLAAAEIHRAAGRIDDAAMLYEGIIDLAPSNAVALKALAAIRLQQGKVEDAMTLAIGAASGEPDNCDACALVAMIALMSDRPDIAETMIDHVLGLDRHHPEANIYNAGLLRQKGDEGNAERSLIAALKIHPDHKGLLTALSDIYMAGGLPMPALDYSLRALAGRPDDADLLTLVGSQLSTLGSHEQALSYLEPAHLQQPGNVVLLAYLAETHLGLGRLTEAQRLAKRLVTLRPHFLPGWQSYVKIMAFRGEAEAVLKEFAALCRQHPDKTEAMLALAGAYRLCALPAQALRLLQPLALGLDRLPAARQAFARMLIRDSCLSLGLFDEAAATFPAFDIATMLSLAPTADGGEPTEAMIAAALADTHLVIDAGITSLDAIVLLRFCRWQGESGAPTLVAGPSSLQEIVALMPGRRFVANDLPQAEDHDRVQRGLPLSLAIALPEALRGGMGDALPYIVAPDDRRAVWRQSLAGLPRPLIAIAWDASRPGLVLEDFRHALAGIDGTLVSIMWDDARRQLAAWPEIIDAGVHFRSLADLAAVIAETDCLVGPDGIPLHVAGAMGTRAALLTMPNWPWHWHHVDSRSSWYPSVTVLQTKALGHWSTGIDDLGARLRAFCNSEPPAKIAGKRSVGAEGEPT